MADESIRGGTDSDPVGGDTIGGVFYQRVKLDLGADGALSPLLRGQQTGANSLPAVLASDDPAVTSLAIMDDWDESDRAKVNIIAGQAGVDGNSGNKSAATVRVVLATDQPQLTNKLLVTPDANSAVNVAQINGVAPSMGSGANGTGVQRVTIATDDGLVAGVGKSASATFTPAASSHVANDCNGAAAQFSFGAPSGCCFMITDASLEIDGGTAEATAWRLYLYNVTPPSATADDGAWDLASGDRASFLGYVDLGTAVDLGSTQWVENHCINKTVKLSGTSVFGYLVNLTTLTPANVAHIVTLHGLPI